ncbi:DUF397 domain-containing protein, partial [Micromonospora rifamycinica]|uniref:DUF397 domain-containing protein n=1 Tax=Micromonospora rifamycinica TaxID=291594 RepID=UPI0033F68002
MTVSPVSSRRCHRPGKRPRTSPPRESPGRSSPHPGGHDSKDPSGPALAFAPAGWQAFVGLAK